ncbi:MAG: DUF1566 domain-containing protein [Nitrospira sp. BO4]|jgi:hypothetical protein|nr:DUF1566 domain-containing protein [Nitrospira sp. BO4]
MESIKNGRICGVRATVLFGAILTMGSLGVIPAAQADKPVDKDGNHTLRWDSNLPSTSRFTTAFPGAVLDKNTGLVWEQAPEATLRTWGSASSFCLNKNIGGTRGWRLPSVAELASLIDPSLSSPFIPSAVFTGVLPENYWSVTSSGVSPSDAWYVDLVFGGVGSTGKNNPNLHFWCVRGGMNADVY